MYANRLELIWHPKHSVKSACLDLFKALDRLQPSIVSSIMSSYSFNENSIKLVIIFLLIEIESNVLNFEIFLDYTSFGVGSPQGTNLGPVSWLINVKIVDGFYSLKYPYDTTVYQPCHNTNNCNQIGSAIESASKWSSENSCFRKLTKIWFSILPFSSQRILWVIF